MTEPSPLDPDDAFSASLAAALAPAFVLGRELAGGGMSRVYLAEERALGRPVVVKVLPPDLAAGVNRERFRREIQLAARLQHPHIVPLLAAGEADGSLWYTMPYIEGESVRAAVARGQRFTVRAVVRVLHDVMEALAYAHARGVIHRDVKPGNVLLQGAHALVTDFGVAKALSAARSGGGDGGLALTGMGGTTSTGLAIGTPAYMAPEQLAADPAADHRMDLYAAGLLAYELCTGVSPFVAESPRATLAAQLTRMPEPLHRVRPEVPEAFSGLVMRLLAKEPGERPASADEVLGALETARADEARASEARAGAARSDPATGWGGSGEGEAVTAGGRHGEGRHGDGATTTAAVAGAGGRRHAWVVGGMVAGGALALLTAVAVSRLGWGAGRAEGASARVASASPASGARTPGARTPGARASVAPTSGAPTSGSPAAAPPAVPTPQAPQAATAEQAQAARITRADSLAIAAAVERQMRAELEARQRAEAPPMPATEVAALRARAWQHHAAQMADSGHWRRYGDSIGAVFGQRGEQMAEAIARAVVPLPLPPPGPPSGAGRPGGHPAGHGIDSATVARLAERAPAARPGVRRVALLEMSDGTGRPELAGLAAAVTDEARRWVAASAGYELADPTAVRRALSAGLPPEGVAGAARAGATLSGTVLVRRDGLVGAVVVVHDPVRRGTRAVRVQVPAGADLQGTAAALWSEVAKRLPSVFERLSWETGGRASATSGG